jgi:hypothetical protein
MIGGVLLIALWTNVIMFTNILASGHNPGGTSAMKLITGNPTKVSVVAAAKFCQLVEYPIEQNPAVTKHTSEYRTGAGLYLFPVQPQLNMENYSILPLDSEIPVTRSHFVPIPMTKAVAADITSRVFNPKSKCFSKLLTKKRKDKDPSPGDSDDTSPPEPDPVEPAPPEPPAIPPSNVLHTPGALDMQAGAPPAAGGVEPLPGVADTPLPRAAPGSFPRTRSTFESVFAERLPNIRDELLAEEVSPRELARVSPDGTVSYRAVSQRGSLRIDNISLVSYSDIKDEGYNFSTQVSLAKSLKQSPKESIDALINEIDGLLLRKVWTGVLRSNLSKTQRKKIIRSSAFIKQKFDLQNKLTKWKARIVTDGRMQDRNLFKPEDISSPTVQLNSLLTLASIAAAEGLKVKTMDIAQAYLNADMPHDLYVLLEPAIAKVLIQRDPTFEQFREPNGTVLVKLNKAQYGCVESARLWYNTIAAFLESKGFVKNFYDPCIFVRQNAAGVKLYCAIYVDDIKAICADQAELDLFQFQLEEIFGKVSMKDGPIHEYLGMLFDYSNPGQVKVNMEKYLSDIVNEADVTSSADTPAADNLFVISPGSPLLPEPERENLHRVVAQLLYAAVRVRPDILLPVIFLSSRVTKATKEDAHKLRRVLRYINGTLDMGIFLGADKDGALRVYSYADASYGVHADAKSHSGIFISLGRGPVITKSVKTKIVAKSSTEAELVTLSDSMSLAAFQLNFMESLGFNIKPGILYQDNISTMRLAENGRSNSDRTKHIKIRYFFVKQYLDSGEFEMVHCPTDLMIADILTKPLQGEAFKRLRDYLLGIQLANSA